MKLFVSLLVLVFSAISINANASTIFTQCNSCNSANDYKLIAESNVSMIGTHTVYIMNLTNDSIHRVYVEYEPSEPPYFNTPTYYSQYLSVDSSTRTKFDNFVAAKNDFINFFNTNQDIPDSVTPSAWNLTHQGFASTAVINHYNDNTTLISSANLLANSALVLAGKIININVIVDLTFSDGSIASFKLTGVNTDLSFDLDFVGGVDPDGNPIPKSANQLNGTYVFSEGNSGLGNFGSAAGSFIGAGVDFSGSPVSVSGGGTVMDCTTDQDGNTTCVVRKIN